ncbi:MAG TPA: hypothetical protein VGC26_10995 [Afipia sp.]
MTRSRAQDEGFTSPSSHNVSSRLADAVTAAVAALFLSMGLIVAITILSIRVAAAMQAL